jgi:hypothetical protein
MDESAGHTVAFEEFLHRPRLEEVIVSLHHDDRRADLADRFEGGCAADIPEVPDFIGGGDGVRYGLGETIVCVGNDGDAEHWERMKSEV